MSKLLIVSLGVVLLWARAPLKPVVEAVLKMMWFVRMMTIRVVLVRIVGVVLSRPSRSSFVSK